MIGPATPDSETATGQHVAPADRTIVAIGGHDFTAAPGNSEIGDYLLGLSPVESPRVCLLPTASGDPVEQISRFRQFFGLRGAAVSHLSLFRLEQSGSSVAETLFDQHIIYVGGGSLINLMAILRAHGIDEILTEAWRRGVIVCGQSAGAMCWFQTGITRSSGVAGAAPGLGLIEATLSVHYHRDPDRREAILEGVGSSLAPGWGIDDQAALRFAGPDPLEGVSGRDGAGIWRIEPGPDGAIESRFDARRVSADSISDLSEDDAISELRAARALRSRGGDPSSGFLPR